MIRVSDNTATNLLISRLGMDRIGALAQEFGLRHTALRRRMMDVGALARGQENTTSASDMANLLAEIWGGSLLWSGARYFALESLLGQRLASRLPIVVPAGTRYAHKTGELRGVENVAGLVLPPGRVLVPAVLAQGDLGLVSAPCRLLPGSCSVVGRRCRGRRRGRDPHRGGRGLPPLYLRTNAACLARCTSVKYGLILRPDKPWATSENIRSRLVFVFQAMWLGADVLCA